jgi:hypothetical protein
MEAMFDRPPRYQSYLITTWEERGRDPGAAGVWRFRLEDPRTGQRRAFASLEALLAALERDMVDHRVGGTEAEEGAERR